MTIEEIHSQLDMCRHVFENSVRDSFGQAIERDVFGVCGDAMDHLQEASEQAETEKHAIDAMLFELRLIL